MQSEGKKRVLVVDNNEPILATFQKVLERAGFDTHTTWSGREALTLLQSKEFDVLLVDDYLPDLHASDFLNRVGRLPIQPWIVVMQASAPTASQRRHYVSLGASAIVRKQHLAAVCKAVGSCCADEPLAKVTSVNLTGLIHKGREVGQPREISRIDIAEIDQRNGVER
jgi:CheY-like chemotaxis protein